MKVFVAGASGALGAQLVHKLVAAGHDVVAMTKTPSKQVRLRALGARPVVADALRHVPRWLGRLAAGEAATAMMTDASAASNAKAKREFDWQLRYPTWRLGFVEGLG